MDCDGLCMADKHRCNYYVNCFNGADELGCVKAENGRRVYR